MQEPPNTPGDAHPDRGIGREHFPGKELAGLPQPARVVRLEVVIHQLRHGNILRYRLDVDGPTSQNLPFRYRHSLVFSSIRLKDSRFL